MSTVEGERQPVDVSLDDVVAYLRVEGTLAEAMRTVTRRKLAAAAARQGGIAVSDEELQKTADGFRTLKGLKKASDTEAWMTANGVTLDALEEFLETNILISKMKDRLAAEAIAECSSRKEVQAVVRDLAFEDWIGQQLAE